MHRHQTGITAGATAVVVALAALAASAVLAQEPAADEGEDLYVLSFRFCASWKAEGEEGDEFMRPPQFAGDDAFVTGPIDARVFLDPERFAEAVAPPGDRKVRVSPVYTLICGPGRTGAVEGGTGDKTWRVEATATPNEDGTVRVVARYDLDAATPNPVRKRIRGQAGEEPAGRL